MSLLLNIIWPIIGSTGIAGLLMFILKKHIERKIDHKFKQIEISQKLHFEEVFRRQSKLFDEQLSSYKILSATTYRLKNSSRAIYLMISKGNSLKDIRDEMKMFKSCESLLSETMYADKLIIEDSAFSIIHDLKHACNAFIQTVCVYETRENIEDINNLKNLADRIEAAHFEGLSMYKQAIEAPPTVLAGLN